MLCRRDALLQAVAAATENEQRLQASASKLAAEAESLRNELAIAMAGHVTSDLAQAVSSPPAQQAATEELSGIITILQEELMRHKQAHTSEVAALHVKIRQLYVRLTELRATNLTSCCRNVL